MRAFWNDVAEDWRVQVGREGDVNRRLASDPVLWALLGSVEGKRVLDAGTTYTWDFPYFEESRQVDPPWHHFTREFIWFHRPLSAYWKAFRAAGFVVEEFEEPRVAPERYPAAEAEGELRKLRNRPYSVAFRLRKPAGA